MSSINVSYNILGNGSNLSKTLSGLLNQANKLDAKMSELGKNLGGKAGGGSGFSKITSSLGGIAKMAGLATVAFAAWEGITGITSIGVEAEKTRVAFEVMLGSVSKASTMIGDLRKLARETPMQFTDLEKNTKMLLNYNVAQKDIIPTLKMLGDVAGGDTERFNRMAYAFGQINVNTKLNGQDLRQLIEVGFNPLQIISEKTGIKMSELSEKMRDGAISSDMVKEAFKIATSEGGKFHNMMEKQAKTIGGRWSNVMDRVQETAIKMFNVIQPALSKGLDLIGSAFDFITVNFEKIKRIFAPLVEAVQPLIWAFEDIYEEIVGVNSASDAMAGIVNVVGTVIDYVSPFVLILAENLGKVVKATWQVIKVFVGLADKIGIFKGWSGELAAFLEIFRYVASTIGDLASGIGNVLEGTFTGNFKMIKEGAVDLANGLNKTLNPMMLAKLGKSAFSEYKKGYEKGFVLNDKMKDTKEEAAMASLNRVFNQAGGEKFKALYETFNNKKLDGGGTALTAAEFNALRSSKIDPHSMIFKDGRFQEGTSEKGKSYAYDQNIFDPLSSGGSGKGKKASEKNMGMGSSSKPQSIVFEKVTFFEKLEIKADSNYAINKTQETSLKDQLVKILMGAVNDASIITN